MAGLVAIILVILAIFFGLFVMGENEDQNACKQKYGSDYSLTESAANSSIRYCKAPDGTLKDLP